MSQIKISAPSRVPHDGLGGFSLSEARTIVGEYFRPNPWIYWTDFLASWAIGTLCFALTSRPHLLATNALWHNDDLAATTGWHWPAMVGLFFAASFLYYR